MWGRIPKIPSQLEAESRWQFESNEEKLVYSCKLNVIDSIFCSRFPYPQYCFLHKDIFIHLPSSFQWIHLCTCSMCPTLLPMLSIGSCCRHFCMMLYDDILHLGQQWALSHWTGDASGRAESLRLGQSLRALLSSLSQCLEKISLFQDWILGLMWLTEQHWAGWNSVPNCAPLEYGCCAFRNLLLIFRVAPEDHCHQCSQRGLCWSRWLTGCGLCVHPWGQMTKTKLTEEVDSVSWARAVILFIFFIKKLIVGKYI